MKQITKEQLIDLGKRIDEREHLVAPMWHRNTTPDLGLSDGIVDLYYVDNGYSDHAILTLEDLYMPVEELQKKLEADAIKIKEDKLKEDVISSFKKYIDSGYSIEMCERSDWTFEEILGNFYISESILFLSDDCKMLQQHLKDNKELFIPEIERKNKYLESVKSKQREIDEREFERLKIKLGKK